jgi:hypothetical protein
MLGLTLIALSIGFNMARYPVVWELAGPVKPSEVPQPTADAPSALPETSAPQPAPDPAPSEKPTAAPEPARATASPSTVAGETPSSANMGSEPSRPLVPIVPVGFTGSAPAPAANNEVRRLPPVTPGDAANDLGPTYDRSIPIYPTTGIK